MKSIVKANLSSLSWLIHTVPSYIIMFRSVHMSSLTCLEETCLQKTLAAFSKDHDCFGNVSPAEAMELLCILCRFFFFHPSESTKYSGLFAVTVVLQSCLKMRRK